MCHHQQNTSKSFVYLSSLFVCLFVVSQVKMNIHAIPNLRPTSFVSHMTATKIAQTPSITTLASVHQEHVLDSLTML